MITIRKILTIAMTGLTHFPFAQKDTVFIQKDSLLGSAQSIYFDNNLHSRYYDSLSNFVFAEFGDQNYNSSINYFKKNKLTLIKKSPIIPIAKWIKIEQYKGKMYTYYPCDLYNLYRSSINDTAYIDWDGEGETANKIIKQKKIDDETFEFVLTGIYKRKRKLIIHIIDKEKGIAVFEDICEKSKWKYNKGKMYYLMIDANKIRSVPLIANNSEIHKQSELDFDEPNFAELLKK